MRDDNDAIHLMDDAIYKHALSNHKDQVAMIWQCAGKDYQLILRVINKAVATKEIGIIRTLQQIDGIAAQLSQCLYDSVQVGAHDVVTELIASNVDIVESLHSPARFIYLAACANSDMVATILTSWKNKNNRNIPEIIEQACVIAKVEQKEHHDICDFLNGWLLSQVL